MRLIAKLADARGTIEGKILATIMAVVLAFSTTNLFMWNDVAIADEAIDEGTEQSQESGLQQNDEGDAETDATEGESGEGQDGEDLVVQNTEGTSEEDQQDGENSDPVEPYVFDAATGTLTITGNGEDELTHASFQEGIKGLGVTSAEVINLTISNVKSIASYALYSTRLPNVEAITISDVETIGDHAFYQLAKLNTVKLTNVKNVGTGASSYLQGNVFAECFALESVSLENIGLLGAEAFRQARALNSLDMKNINEIGRSPFSYCISLKAVDIDGTRDGITSLGKSPFYGCIGLESVSLSNLESVGDQAFYGLINESSVGGEDKNVYSKLQNLDMTNIQHVGKNVFTACTALKNVVLNEVTIDDRDYRNDDGTYSPSFNGAGAADATLIVNGGKVGKYAFYNFKGLTKAEVNGVDTIDQYAFQSCTALTEIKLTDIDTIKNYAFWNCTNLKTIDSLNNVKDSIGGFAFYNCKNLDLTGLDAATLCKMGYIGSHEQIVERIQAILAGKFGLDDAESIAELELETGWADGAVDKSANWDSYDNGTQLMQQVRWADAANGVAEVKVDAYYTAEKQMDYVFVADLSASMAQLGNPEDNNARFYDMQSKLLDMTSKLLDTPGYDCRVSIVTFGGLFNKVETCDTLPFTDSLEEAQNHIWSLEPLNENTNYSTGMRAALDVVNTQDEGRNTTVVFLSDGAPNVFDQGDDHGAIAAQQIKDKGVSIYGVLHSPAASQHDKALGIMQESCDMVYESTDTESFGNAMNKAFAAAHGNNTVTIPYNAVDFDVSFPPDTQNVTVENGTITWDLAGMPFTDHELTYTLTLKQDRLDRVGTFNYNTNNGNATFAGIENGPQVGVDLVLTRTVDPVDNPPVGPVAPTTPTTPTAPVGPAGAPAGAIAPAAAGAGAGAAPAAAATVAIPDEANPLAEAGEETIEDDENALAAFDPDPECWVHWLMVVGIIVTAIYGAAVVIRRRRQIDEIAALEDEVLGRVEEGVVASQAATNGRHSHAAL